METTLNEIRKHGPCAEGWSAAWGAEAAVLAGAQNDIVFMFNGSEKLIQILL